MSMRLLGSSGLSISPLCLGTMNFGNDAWGCDEAESVAILDRYLELGGNFIDTANVYSGGRSEEILGRALKGRRDDVILATKCFFPEGASPNDTGNTRRNIRRQVEASLTRLDTDCIDLYQIHMWDPLTPVEETLSVLSDLVHEGKVHHIGACNLTGWQLASFMEKADANGFESLVSIQPQYSLVCRDIEQEVMPCAEQYGLSILPWSPLGFGLLTGKYANGADEPKGARMTSMSDADVMSKWRERSFNERNFEIVDGVRAIADAMGTTPVALAIRWVIEQPVVSSAIIGPRNVEQLEGNWSALDIAFDEETLEQLETLSEPGDNYLEFMQGGVFVRRLSHLE